MDSKELKAALKSARECIKNKEYKEALKYCKSILVHDQNNYNALVFVGVAADGLDQQEQAVKAYKKAIDSSPDQILAWQGLSGFCEKHSSPENDKELVNVYQKLIGFFESEHDKKTEVLKKLANLHLKLGDVEMCLEIYEKLCLDESDQSKVCRYQAEYVSVLTKQQSLTQNQESKFIAAIRTLLDTDIQIEEGTIIKYIDCILKIEDAAVVKENCRAVNKKYPHMRSPLETIVLLCMDRSLVSDTFLPSLESEFCDTMDKLSEVDGSSHVLQAAQGLKFFCDRDLIKARDLLLEAAGEMTTTVCVQYFLALSFFLLHNTTEADKRCRQCSVAVGKKNRKLSVPSGQVIRKISYLQGRILYEIGTPISLQSALSSLEQVSDSTQSEMALCGNIYLKLDNIEKAQEISCKITDCEEKSALDATMQFYKGLYSEAADSFSKLMQENQASSHYHLMFAKSLWRSKDRTQNTMQTCYTALLKSAKLDPYNSESFEYLGRFYTELQKDKVKGKKCYQKAFDLDRSNDQAGEGLCDLLNDLGQEDEAFNLLLTVTREASAGSCKWAWLRLGLHQVKHDSASVAVNSFQSALRADPKDPHVWECLAEAYYHRGSYTAALKAFNKAAELNPDALYCLYMIACIKQTLSMLTEAVEEYKLILTKSPEYVPALKGLGETYVLLAKHHLTNSFNGRAKVNSQDALKYLTRAVCHRPDFSCLWKLMGDACTIIHPLPPQNFKFEVPEKLYKSKDTEEKCDLSLLQTLELGARCYGRALRLIPECASLWHDLGVNLYLQSNHLIDTTGMEVAEKAVNTLKKALSLDPVNHQLWNALGLVYCGSRQNKPSQGQHCFIKSIQVESANVVAWTNLATLYLKNDNIKLAHEAFKVAQSLDPNYVACWIGQAMIAETVGDEDAMDLFRHTTELSPHIESCIGYGHWVCTLLQDKSKHNTEMYKYAIHQMAAIPAASDALVRYLDRVKTNPAAYNMYGLLSEQQRLYQTAKTAFQSAIDLLGTQDSGLMNKVKTNLARVLCKLGQCAEAIDIYGSVGELESFEDLCQMGLAAYKLQNYMKSYQAYDKALQLCKTDGQRSQIHAMLGMVAYKFGDLDGSKSSLFQCSQLQPPSQHGLEALCALGIQLGDGTLTLAVLQELSGLGSVDSCAHLTVIYNCLVEKNLKAAYSYMQGVIHNYPDNSKLWKLLSRLQLRHVPCYRKSVATTCSKVSWHLQCHSKDLVRDIALGQLKEGKHILNDPGNNALTSAQRAVLMDPENIGGWCTLASAMHGRATVEKSVDTVTAFLDLQILYLSWILSTIATSEFVRVKEWCQKQLSLLLLMRGRKEEAQTVMAENDDIKSFLDVFKKEADRQENDILKAYKRFRTVWEESPENQTSEIFLREIDEMIQKAPENSVLMLMKAGVLMQTNSRLAKHRLVDVLDKERIHASQSYASSVARRCLLHILSSSGKGEENIQFLISEAEEDGDSDTLEYFKNFHKL